jgi:valyl-tRNA synthetase
MGMRLNDYAETARRFVWNELADWYLEAIKGRLADGGDDRDAARAVLVHAFDGALRLLHPIVPFVTEALWQRLPGRADDELLISARWPALSGGDNTGANEFELVRTRSTRCGSCAASTTSRRASSCRPSSCRRLTRGQCLRPRRRSSAG